MILEYHRPQTLEKALELLARPTPPTAPLGGGTVLSHSTGEPVAVVDLQSLGLDTIEPQGSAWVIGAGARLEQLVQQPGLPEALKQAICLDATLNMRNMATLAGSMVTGSGTSALLAVLLALDARLTWQPEGKDSAIGDYLSLRTAPTLGRLITQVQFSATAQVHFAAVGRSPKDLPIVSCAVARWPSGRTRVVIGGDAPAPVLAMDGTEAGDFAILAQNASGVLSTRFASREYLIDAAKTLIQRLFQL